MGRCREMWGDVRRYRVRALCAVNTDEVLEEIGTTWEGSIRGRSRMGVSDGEGRCWSQCYDKGSG